MIMFDDDFVEMRPMKRVKLNNEWTPELVDRLFIWHLDRLMTYEKGRYDYPAWVSKWGHEFLLEISRQLCAPGFTIIDNGQQRDVDTMQSNLSCDYLYKDGVIYLAILRDTADQDWYRLYTGMF
jgi:hypothetical protein